MENKEEKGIFARIYNWFVNLTLRGLLGAILVVFIIIVILMSVSYIPRIMSGISNSLSAALYSVFVPAENASITASKSIMNSGEDFIINFKKGDLTNGIFTVSYACNSSADLVSVETNGLKKIDCDTSYYLLDNETSIKIRPTTSESVVRLVVNGAFENNDTQKTESIGVVRMTIKNDSIGGTVVNTPVSTSSNQTAPANTNTAPTYNTTYVPASNYVQPTYYGKPDLAVRILQTGILNQYNNVISVRNQFTYSDMVGIKFEIRNDGDANTGPWYFTATLPSLSTPVYTSNTQISLKPGESIIFTLGFSDLTNERIGIITINADPRNTVTESIEYNNVLTQTITNSSYNSSHYNNYYNNNNYDNGCYVNGMFTYNCLNNNNYNYNTGGYFDNYGNWISYNNNNTGGYYDSYGNWISYNNYNNNNNLDVTCYAEPDDPSTDDRVRWYAEVDGGNGDYDYEWTGTNGLDSSSRNPSKMYSSRGWKYATVTVTDSDDNEDTANCSVYVTN